MPTAGNPKLQVRVDPDRLRSYRDRARTEGVSLQEWVRESLDKAAEEEKNPFVARTTDPLAEFPALRNAKKRN